MSEQPRCELCGEPMPLGEERFKFHGYSGNCSKPPLPHRPTPDEIEHAKLMALWRAAARLRLVGLPEPPEATNAFISALDALGEPPK